MRSLSDTGLLGWTMHGRPCEFRPEVRRRLARRAHRLSLRRRGPTVRASARQLPQGKVPGRSFELRNDRAHCGIGISARSHMAHSRVTWRTARSHMAHSRVTWRTQSDVAGGLPSATSSSTRQDGTRRATSGSTRHVRFDAPRQVRRASSGSTRQDGICWGTPGVRPRRLSAGPPGPPCLAQPSTRRPCCRSRQLLLLVTSRCRSFSSLAQ